MNKKTFNLIPILCAAVVLCLTTWTPAFAQMRMPTSKPKGPQYTFSEHDFIRAKILPFRKSYFVGEPVVVPIELSNHTRFPLTIQTNTIPRGTLKVTVQPQTGRAYPYYGPYMEGTYAPVNVYLYSLENASLQALIWGDASDKYGLAFSKPGQYTVQMELALDITEADVQSSIKLDPFTLTIVPPPDDIKPIIEELEKNRGFIQIHLREMPPGWNERLLEIVDKYNAQTLRSLTPYLNYVAALYLETKYDDDKTPDKDKLLEKIQIYYQVAAASDSYYKYAATMDFLRFLDKAELYDAARIVAHQVLKVAPPQYIGKIGSNTLLAKYLGNTQELRREALWPLYP